MVMVFIGLPPDVPISQQSPLCRRLRYSGSGFSSAGAVPGGAAEHFTSRQPISSGATCSAGRAKKDGGRCWESVVAMGVA